MLARMFARYSLRTTDVDAARRFYADAIGLDLPEGAAPGSVLEAWPLHERARALGAPPHWLGQIAVSDLDASVESLLARGSERLGPTVRTSEGAAFASVRDPGGAVVAVRADGSPASRAELSGAWPVVWHQLHTRDSEQAWSLYSELFGWTLAETLELPDVDAGLRLFAYTDSKRVAGGMANTARRPGVHPHWLFHFPVSDVQAACERVRALGGQALAPIALPSGALFAACEDPQGAAFGVAG